MTAAAAPRRVRAGPAPDGRTSPPGLGPTASRHSAPREPGRARRRATEMLKRGGQRRERRPRRRSAAHSERFLPRPSSKGSGFHRGDRQRGETRREPGTAPAARPQHAAWAPPHLGRAAASRASPPTAALGRSSRTYPRPTPGSGPLGPGHAARTAPNFPEGRRFSHLGLKPPRAPRAPITARRGKPGQWERRRGAGLCWGRGAAARVAHREAAAGWALRAAGR